MNTQDIDSNSPRKVVEDPTSDMSKPKAIAFPASNNGMTLNSAVVEVVNTRRWKNLLHCDDDNESVASSIKVGVLHDPNHHCHQEGGEEEHYFFPPLQRAESFPLSSHSAPPRRPSRSGSFESKEIVSSSRRAKFLSKAVSSAKEDSEDEIDHQQFRRLLLGRGLSSSSRDNDGNDSDDSRPMSDVLLPSLRYQKSASSAPPKLPSRIGSDSEDATNQDIHVSRIRRTTTAPCGRQKSLPMAVFRPQPVRRRRRSRIQDMIDSENVSSLATPPRLPSRTGSDRSNNSMTGKGDSMPGVLMLCPSTPGSKSTDTPARRPRRSLSPMCSSAIHSLFNNATTMDDEDSLEVEVDIEVADLLEPVVDNLPEGGPESPVLMQKDPSPVTEAKRNSQVRKNRKVPRRAKTFSFHTKKTQLLQAEPLLVATPPIRNTSCVSLLSTSMMSTGEDTGTVKSLEDPPPSIADLHASMESILSSKTWPRPRRTRVAPGRSRTFSFYQSASTSRS